MLFAKATHAIGHWSRKHIRWSPAQPFVGGIIVAAAVFALQTTRYIGLGIPTIVAAMKGPLPWYDFALKFGFTAVTLGTGFKGGEVTPLFFIGSTLGNTLSHALPLPSSLLAAMGFVAVFAGAANTPVSSSLMAVELFGAEAGAFAAIACVTSYLFSGHSGIYHAQRVGVTKHAALLHEEGLSLGAVAQTRTQAEDTAATPNESGSMKRLSMANVSVVRLYFSAAEVLKLDAWWHRIMPQNLGAYLLQQARDANIEQTLLHRVTGGYLKDPQLLMDSSDTPPLRLPQCPELVGAEESLQRFFRQHQQHMGSMRVLFLRGEEARIEAAIDQQEKEAFDLEREDRPQSRDPAHPCTAPAACCTRAPSYSTSQ